MAPVADNTIVMENVRLIFRNFAGKEGQFNREGDRVFSVVLDDEIAKTLDEDGWNVKELKAREGEEGDDLPPVAIMQVAVKYGKGRPPRIVLITSRGRNSLDESEVEMLDWADITNVDLIVRPYAWTVNGKSGIKAYLKSMFVTINEDPLEAKYGMFDDEPDTVQG